MDLNKLRTLVFDKTGIKIDTSDPIFALVALNEAVLAECVEQHIANLQGAADQLKEQTTHLIEAGDRVKKLLLQMGQTVEEPTAASVKTATPERTALPWRWIWRSRRDFLMQFLAGARRAGGLGLSAHPGTGRGRSPN